MTCARDKVGQTAMAIILHNRCSGPTREMIKILDHSLRNESTDGVAFFFKLQRFGKFHRQHMGNLKYYTALNNITAPSLIQSNNLVLLAFLPCCLFARHLTLTHGGFATFCFESTLFFSFFFLTYDYVKHFEVA